MNLAATPTALTRWTDPNASREETEEKALAVRLSIGERCAAVRKQKENYATALTYLEGVPLPYDCRLPGLEDECLEIERCAWRAFIDDLHLREVLSIAARKTLDEQLDSHRDRCDRSKALPPFEEANVWGFFEQTCRDIPNLIREALAEVFKWLTPSARWTGCKTSNEFEVGKKVVLCGVARTSFSGRLETNHYHRGEIDALGNALWMLDGRGVRKSEARTPEEAKDCGPYWRAWSAAWGRGEVYEDDFLTAKAFKNGNAHLVFKRPDIVAKINQAAGEWVLQSGRREATRGFSH